MLEKEIKILEIDLEKLQKKLESIWAIKIFEWFIHDIYYDFSDNWKFKMEDNQRLFRVRQKWEIHLYTIKRKRNTEIDWWEKWYKIADEWERQITDVESFKKVLENYWMIQVREKKKYRISYTLNWIEFDIDKYDNIPTLLEIEANTSEEIEKYILILELEKNIKKNFWSRWLYKYYSLEYNYL